MAQADFSPGETDAAARPQRGDWLRGQNRAFRAALDGEPLAVSLGILAETAREQFDDGVRCAFYMADPTGRTLHHVVGMPESYARQVDGFRTGKDLRAWGLAAGATAPVITADVREEPRGSPWLWLAEEYGYRGCWLFPVETSGEFVGTFALYFPQPRAARPEDMALAETLTGSAAIIIAEHRTREALETGEARQAYLLALSDVLRGEADPARAKSTATALLGRQLRVNRVFYADAAEGRWHVTKGYEQDIESLPDVPFEMNTYGKWIIDDFRAGKRLVVDDMRADPRFDEAERKAHLDLRIGSEVALPLVKNGELRAILVVHAAARRNWSEPELALLDETAERTWSAVERARAEAGLREKEAKYRTLFESIDTGYCVIEVLFDRAGKPFDYVFLEANPAFVDQTGLADAIGKPVRSLIPGHEQFWFDTYGQIARTGRPERFEHRADALDRWYSVYAVRVGEPGQNHVAVLFEDVKQRKLAEQALRESETRSRLLLAELQHRVRNILSVVRSVFARTVEAGGLIEDMAEHFRGRLDALARTQGVVTGNPQGTADLENLVRDELLSVGVGDGPALSIAGPEVELAGEVAEALALAVHELTTNSIKYGALRFAESNLAIRWLVNLDYGDVRRLVFIWEEQGVPAMPVDPGREGFGTELITRALPYRLGAETSFELRPGGVRCLIDLPLQGAAPLRGAQ